METKETKANVVSNEVKSAIKEIVNDSKLAKDSVKSKVLGVMYFVNQLNKLAKKNEFIDGVSLANFGKRVKALSNEKELFTARLFTPDSQGRASYIKQAKNIEKYIAKGYDKVSDTEYMQPVVLSLSGLLSAYTYLLKQAEKAK